MTDYKAALVDLLAEVPMPSITRHWLDEYLEQLDDPQKLQMRIHELEERVFKLEYGDDNDEW